METITRKKRLRELDFLRGIAILLVLFRHQFLYEFTQKAGWIGVDLFFVLSGFLVSGLLFKEFQRFGNIRPKLFLIRRGFKIYPIYYLFYSIYLIPIVIQEEFNATGFIADMLFIQNYIVGWGYAYAPSWSLAVEEHFYFATAAVMFFILREKNSFWSVGALKTFRFERWIVAILVLCLAMRIVSNVYLPEAGARNITMTHLRIDSLLAGVLISFWYHFKRQAFTLFIQRHKKWLLVVAMLLLSFTPFVEHSKSIYVLTIGFTVIYIAFGIVLSWFLTDGQINRRLDRYLSATVVNGVAKIGVASYSIYIIHSFVNYAFNVGVGFVFSQPLIPIIMFLTTSLISILCGLFMTTYVETFFLNIRDRYFPARNAESRNVHLTQK